MGHETTQSFLKTVPAPRPLVSLCALKTSVITHCDSLLQGALVLAGLGRLKMQEKTIKDKENCAARMIFVLKICLVMFSSANIHSCVWLFWHF